MIIKEISVQDNERFVNNLLQSDFKRKKGQEQKLLKCSFGIYEESYQVGGIIAKHDGEELHVSLLAVDPNYQKKGYGKKLLMICEEYAEHHGCTMITVTTQDFQAPDFYQKYGYEVFAELSDVPIKGTTRYYLVKRL